MKLFLLGALFALWYNQVGAQDDYCFGKDTERAQTRHFTSKTAYQIIKSTNIDKQYLVPGCEPQKIWILHRHGTRLPSKNIIGKAPHLESLRDSIVQNYRVAKTAPETNALCQEDLIALQMWKWNTSITNDVENYLTSQGYEDLRGTAKTYQRYYPNVLTKVYNKSNYLFRSTDTQRTTESLKAFSEGLFGSAESVIPQEIPEKDMLLRPYDYCESYKAQNFKDEGSENYKYRRSAIWNETLAAVSKRLGFLYTLESDDVELMFDICRYEQAWQVDRTSVWCAAFTPSQVTVLEYDDDIKYYYKSGYGYESNTKLNCRAVQDMVQHLSSNEMPNVVAYFVHSTGVQTFVSALGIAKDEANLLANNYDSLANRKWKTSNIDPFGANFVAVKYQCATDSIEKEKVIFFLNQNAVDLEWCQVGLCSWSEVKKRYSTILNADCSKYYCGDGASAIRISFVSLIMAAVLYLMNVI